MTSSKSVLPPRFEMLPGARPRPRRPAAGPLWSPLRSPMDAAATVAAALILIGAVSPCPARPTCQRPVEPDDCMATDRGQRCAGMAFPAPAKLPCGGWGGGWRDVTVLDPDDERAIEAAGNARGGENVHVTGALKPVDLNDEEFQFLRKGIALHRVVEMFQWDRDPDAPDGLYPCVPCI